MTNANPNLALQGEPLESVATDVASLPDDKFLEAVELLNAMSEADPVGSLLSGLRPRLRTLRPSRALNIKRLLCDPFEDLLYSSPDLSIAGGKVPRQAIEPLWALLQRRNGAHFKSLQAELKMISRREPKRISDLSERIWRTASATLAMEGDVGKTLPPALSLIKTSFATASEIAAFKRLVPAVPIPKLDKHVASAIQKTLNALLLAGKPVDAFLYVVAARLNDPAQLLAFLSTVDIAIPAAMSEKLTLSSIDNLGADTDAFRETALSMNPETLAAESVRLLHAVREMQRTLGSSAKNALALKTQGLADAIRTSLRTQVIERVGGVVEEAFAPSATLETMVEAETLARAMRTSRQASSLVGLDNDRDASVTRIRRTLQSRIGEAVAVLDRSKDKEAPIPVDRTQLAALYRSIRMIELVEGAEAALPYIDKARSYG